MESSTTDANGFYEFSPAGYPAGCKAYGRWLKRLTPGRNILLGGRNIRSSSFSSAARLKPVIGALQLGQQSPAAHTSKASVQ